MSNRCFWQVKSSPSNDMVIIVETYAVASSYDEITDLCKEIWDHNGLFTLKEAWKDDPGDYRVWGEFSVSPMDLSDVMSGLMECGYMECPR